MPYPSPEGRQLIAHLQQLDAELTRQRRLRLGVRAAWIAGLVLCLGLIGRIWLGAPITTPLLLLITGLSLALGLAYAWMPARGPDELASAFDRAYNLQAQLATAAEVSAAGEVEGFGTLLTDRARRRLAFIDRDVKARIREPLRLEVQTLGMVLALGAGIALLGGLRTALPTAPATDLPALRPPGAAEPPASAQDDPAGQGPAPGGERPAGNQPGGQPELDQEGQQAAEALADALGDNGATRAAADALQRGDTQAAADEIRRLADQADQLSPEARDDIAASLEQAANELQADQPDLADRLRRDAAQLRRDDPISPAAALDDLARAIEELAESEEPAAGQPPGQNDPGSGAAADPGEGQGQSGEGQSGQEGQSDQSGTGGGPGQGGGGQSRTSPPAEAGGQDVPLPPAADLSGPTTPGQGAGETTITLPGDGTGGGGAGGRGGSVPGDITDPATIPPELRDAIQDYFER
ncbi:MAG TPA: hypothetical protein VD886_23715 [Herpetosiphonaceae bacterium]|nr:hypothetical protein [Herpetosiphonaceae bacterium]